MEINSYCSTRYLTREPANERDLESGTREDKFHIEKQPSRDYKLLYYILLQPFIIFYHFYKHNRPLLTRKVDFTYLRKE